MDAIDLDFYQPTPKEIQVWRVCDALLSENKRITYQSIGEHLLTMGLKRGSNSDICRYLASWKKHHYPKTKLANRDKKSQVTATKRNSKIKHNDLGYVYESLQNIENSQSELLERIKNVGEPSSTKASTIRTDSLLKIIKEQRIREEHYLAALSHSRDIQSLLKSQINQYQHQLRNLEAKAKS